MSNDIADAIADLRKVVEQNPNRDRFPLGTVIRWVSRERYTYVAVKTGYAWFTTAQTGNRFVKQLLNYEQLREVLQRDEVSDIAVATEWSTLEGRPAATPVQVETRPTGALFREGRGLVSPSRAGLYPEGDPSADAGNDAAYDDSAVGFGGFGGEHV